MRYVALIDGKPGNYGVVIPDLPGCTSAGKTLDDALHNAIEAVALWVEDARADGEAIPQARSIESLRQDKDVQQALSEGALSAIVPLLIDYGRPAKVHLSFDAGLLAAIDAAAKVHGLTRSTFMATAAREKIERS